VFAIRSERALCRDVRVNLAYRWFCGLSIEDKIPDHSAFSRALNDRFGNQARGLLKDLGRVIGRAKFNGFAARAAELIEDRPELIAVVAPLLKAREAIEEQIDDLDGKVLKVVKG
jgi:hypothetical protein